MAEVPPGVVRVMSTVPADPVGEVAVQLVVDEQDTAVPALTPNRAVVLDAPTSALDVSLRSRVILLLERLREELDLAYLFISHDIATVKYLAGRIAVMYLGVIVEQGSAAEVIGNPLHPYTRALVSAVPIPDPDRRRARFVLRGEPPGSASVVAGCRLRGRCPLAIAVCAQPVPLREVSPGRLVACHLV